MSNLSEKEIINSITPIVNARKTHKDDNLYSLHLNAYQLDGLQGLLNLYKQNEESCTKYLAEIGQLRTKLHAEKEKNKELIQGQVKTLDEILQPELLKKYISKDKIRELKKFYINDCVNRNITLIPLKNLVANINILLEEK